MTYEDIRIAALGRALRFSPTVPTTRTAAYRRIAQRDAHLVTKFAALNADYFGAEAVLPVVDGVVDFSAVGALRLAGVVVHAGTEHPAGTPVAIVPQAAPESGFPPRVTARKHALVAVDDELAGVASVRLAFVQGPPPVSGTTAASEPRLPDAFHELLAVDLARVMAVQACDEGAASAAALAPLLDALASEEAELLRDCAEFIVGYAATESRFAAAVPTATPAERGAATRGRGA